MELTRPLFDDREVNNLRACLESGWVTQGPWTTRFEAQVATLHQTKYALATTSCTAALHLSTLALGLGPGDEVIVPAFTWVTTANAVEYVGARAVFVDVDPFTYNIDVEAVEAAITERTRAIIAVHLFGLAADMEPIQGIAARHGLAVIEDAACAIGTSYHGRPVGGLGRLACFSFHPRKVITTGEGGMVTTDDPDLADRIASLRNHGSTGVAGAEAQARRPWTMASFDLLGFNLRLSDIQAAVGVAQFEKLEPLLAERRAAARRYTEILGEVEDIVLPTAGDVAGHTYQSYVVRLREGGRDRRNEVMVALERENIQTRPGTHAVHRLGYYREKYELASQQFPVATSSEDETITLPLFPGITDNDQERVASVLRSSLAR